MKALKDKCALKIFLVRHAESEANVGGIFEHNKLVKLTELGKQQAKDLVEILEKDFPKADKIIVSKFIRTVETAEPFLQKNSYVESHLWLDTHEFDYLDRKPFLNKPEEEFKLHAKKYWTDNDPFIRHLEDGETFQEFVDRVHNVIQKMHMLDGVNYLFTHGHFIAMFGLLTKSFTKQSFEMEKNDPNFYKDLMVKLSDSYESGDFMQAKNTEVRDVSELVENYVK